MTQRQILAELRRMVNIVGSQKQVASDLLISVQYLNDVLRGRRQPGPKILKGLGLEKTDAYRKLAP